MNKIPCIECSVSTWAYIKPYLKSWGYREYCYFRTMSIENSILFIDWNNDTGYNFGPINNVTTRRELVTNVEEFLERAAKLKGFTYKRKDIMEFHGIEIKAGMIIDIDEPNANNVSYIVFPRKDRLAVVKYGTTTFGSWGFLDSFIERNYNTIKRIYDVAEGDKFLQGNVIWERKKYTEVTITMDEIAKKFGVSVEQIKIKK